MLACFINRRISFKFRCNEYQQFVLESFQFFFRGPQEKIMGKQALPWI